MHGLDWYDYSARMHDAALGRFTTVDSMAELYYNWSPYSYTFNNPLRFTDPSGAIPVDSVKWDTFDPVNDQIDLNDVLVVAESPWTITERGGAYFMYNVFTNQRGRVVGEKGLENKDWVVFDILLAGRLSSTRAASASVSTISTQEALRKLSESAITRGVNYVMRNPNKINHIFNQARHNLAPLVTKLGGQENTVKTVLNTLNSAGNLPVSGLFESTISIGGTNITVRGIVQEGFPKIATMFIP